MSLFSISAMMLVSVFIPLLTERFGRTANTIATMVVPAIALAYIVSQIPVVLAGNVITETLAWIPSAGLTLSMRLDGLALMFAFAHIGHRTTDHSLCPLLSIGKRSHRTILFLFIAVYDSHAVHRISQ